MWIPLAGLLVCGLGFAAAAPASDIFDIADVRPGMRGTGLTVFQGTQVEEFDVEVIGVLENGPRQQLILARLTGGPLAETGVIAGMSGSPVYIDDKLVGAVSYGFPFSKQTIAGITPIGEMISATSTQAPRAAVTRAFTRVAEQGLPALSADALVEALRAQQPRLTGPLWALSGANSRSAALAPLALPLVFSGFDQSAFSWAQETFSALGFIPVMGASATHSVLGPIPDLEAGGAVGVALIDGDLDLSVTGTITYIDDNRVYAFGHPFYNLGPTQFPMTKAYVYSVFPSLYQSWKISSALEPVGTIDQDRVTAIAGTIGATPRMIPVDVKLTTSRGRERSFSFRVVEDELFTPVLVYTAMLSVLQANERAFGTSTMKLEATLDLENSETVSVGNLFARDQPALRSAILIAAPLSYLMSNDFAPVLVERLKVDVTSLETVETATLSRVWLEREGPVRPGSELTLKVQFRTYRGENRTEALGIRIPVDATPGEYALLVGDADAFDARERTDMEAAFIPRDLDQLVRAINALRRSDHVYAQLFRPDHGVIVDGEYLPSLPPSVLQVLSAGSSTDSVSPVPTASVWESSVGTDFAVSGARQLRLTVEP
jgi:hypothetical protein